MTYRDLEARPIILAQAWPATVTLPTGEVVSPARVVLTATCLYVWARVGEPVLAAPYVDTDLRGTFEPPTRPSRVGLLGDDMPPRLRTVVEWVPAAGCGCSHPLKGFRPFAPMRLGSR